MCRNFYNSVPYVVHKNGKTEKFLDIYLLFNPCESFVFCCEVAF